MGRRRIKLMHLFFSCSACPSQWEGWSTQWEPVYIRYRHGILAAEIGPKKSRSWWQFGTHVIYLVEDHSGLGVMTTPEMKRRLCHLFAFPKKIPKGSLPGTIPCPPPEMLDRLKKNIEVAE